jgi:hypothetical protein
LVRPWVLNVLYSFSNAARSVPVIVVFEAGCDSSTVGGNVPSICSKGMSSLKGLTSPLFGRDEMLRRAAGRVAGFHC